MKKFHFSRKQLQIVAGFAGAILMATVAADQYSFFQHKNSSTLSAQILESTVVKPVIRPVIQPVIQPVVKPIIQPVVQPAKPAPVLPKPAPIKKQVVKSSGSVGLPVRIKIPKIAVDAPIERVALASDGSMDVPKKPFNTGWYALGPRPGEKGSAAIAGHLNWKNGGTAVFARLNKVKPGDKVIVHDESGAVISFVVRETRQYAAMEDATDVFISNDGKSRLSIITCDGEWDKSAKQYTKRFVVFADKETE